MPPCIPTTPIVIYIYSERQPSPEFKQYYKS